MITGALTCILLVVGVINYFGGLTEGTSSTAIFFLGITGAFSVYFHSKTEALYPFSEFNDPLEELSKKYWALHISFGLTLLILGIFITVNLLKRSADVTIISIAIFMNVLGLWTLLDLFFLNKFIVSHKKRLAQREEIENIKGTVD